MKKRILYFDFLKVIASIAVVFIHVISEFWYGLTVTSLDFKILTIFDSLARFCVPIYFMISGAIFLNEEKKLNIKDIFFKYILRIFLIFLFWNLIYECLNIVFLEHSIITKEIVVTLLKNTILGQGVFHLSFLVIIIGFYLCVPVLRLITKKENKNLLKYLIIILFAFTSIKPILLYLFDIKISYSLVFSGYLLYFILGYYLNTFEVNKNTTKVIYILGIISLITTSVLTIYYSNYLGKPSELFFDYLTPNVVIYSSCIFLLSKNIFKISNDKGLNLFAKTYFGVYLIHGLILGFYLQLGLFNLNMPLGLLVILLTIIIYFTSLLVSFIMGYIPLIKKLIY